MRYLVLAIALVAGLAPGRALAEFREVAVGVEGGVVLPALESADRTAFRLITLGAGVFARYGISPDVDLELRVDFSLFRGQVDETRAFRSRSLEGIRYFRAEQYAAVLGVRYKLVSGYFLAPYVEAHAGVLWLILRDQQFLDPLGRSFGLELVDEGRGALTLSGGIAVDYRLFDMGFVGVAVRWVELVGGGLHRRYLSVPVEVAVYW